MFWRGRLAGSYNYKSIMKIVNMLEVLKASKVSLESSADRVLYSKKVLVGVRQGQMYMVVWFP